MDSVIFSENGDKVLMFYMKHNSYYGNGICSEEWHIYDAETNSFDAEIYIQGDMVTFYEYDEKATCDFYQDSCGIIKVLRIT